MKSPYLLLLTVTSALAGPSAKDVVIPDGSNDRWRISSVSVGASWRHFGELKYRGGTRSQNLPLSSFIGGDSLTLPEIGTEGDYADRTYNDGYVNQSGGTADHGLTWFWGYDSAPQVQTGSMAYTATGARSAYRESSAYQTPLKSTDDIDGFSPHLDMVITPPESSPQMFDGILVSFSYFGDAQKAGYSSFAAQQIRDDYRLDFTDRYDLDGVIPPSAGYQGSYNGPGPSIGNLPTDRDREDVLIHTDIATLSNSVTTSFNLDAFSMAFGPTFSGQMNGAWQWQAACGATVNVFKWRAQQTERLSLTTAGSSTVEHRQWVDKNSGTVIKLGLFARGELIRDFSNGVFLNAYVQGEVADPLEVDLGPSRFDLKQAGYSLGLSVGKRF